MTPSQDGIWIINEQAVTVYANDRMAEILGTTAAEMTGAPSFNYVFPEDVEKAQRLFDFKSRGDAGSFRFQLRRKDGSAVAVDVQGTPMRNAQGEFKGIVGTFALCAGSQMGRHFVPEVRDNQPERRSTKPHKI